MRGKKKRGKFHGVNGLSLADGGWLWDERSRSPPQGSRIVDAFVMRYPCGTKYLLRRCLPKGDPRTDDRRNLGSTYVNIVL